jgi:hypothetical protein
VLNGGFAKGPLYGHWQKKPLSDEDYWGNFSRLCRGTSTEGAILDRCGKPAKRYSQDLASTFFRFPDSLGVDPAQTLDLMFGQHRVKPGIDA